MMSIAVRKLPFGERTSQGAFYPTVNGQIVGYSGRPFFETKDEAMECAKHFVANAPVQ